MAERAPVYIVGGAVRDHLLGISSIPGWSHPIIANLNRDADRPSASLSQNKGAATTDLDLVLSGPVLPVARRVADRLGWAFYPLDEARDVARLIGDGADGRRIECDAAALRGDLRSDLLARDFSANALALELPFDSSPRLIDVCGGMRDVAAKRLRRVTPESLPNDPLRLLRAVRLAAQLGFTVEIETRKQILANAETILSVSAERVRHELWKLLDCARPDVGISELHALGLLSQLFPEVEALQGVTQSSRHHLDAYEHTLLAVRYAAELRDWLRGGPPPGDSSLSQTLDPWAEELRTHFSADIAAGRDRAGWLTWHALFHDTGKPGSHSTVIENGIERPRFAGHHQLSAQIAALRVANLRFSRREVLLAERVAALHGNPRDLFEALSPADPRIDPVAAYRFFRDAGSVVAGHQFAQISGKHSGRGPQPFDGLDVTLQAISDRQATGQERGDEWGRFLVSMEGLISYAFSQAAEHLTKPLVDGHSLMKHLRLTPGPRVGDIMRELAEAQAAGKITSENEALALAELLADKFNPSAAVDSHS